MTESTPGAIGPTGPAIVCGGGPQRTELPLQGEHPHGVAIGAALELIAAGRNGNEFFAVDLIDHGWRVGASPPAVADEA